MLGFGSAEGGSGKVFGTVQHEFSVLSVAHCAVIGFVDFFTRGSCCDFFFVAGRAFFMHFGEAVGGNNEQHAQGSQDFIVTLK